MSVNRYKYCIYICKSLLTNRIVQISATPRKRVGTEGTIKVLLPEYQVYKCFIILNNCAIQNSKLEPFLMDF